MPRVSVMVPSYNHEKFVGEAIASIQCQTFQDFEIVVTDDASQDRSAAVIEAIDDPRLKFNRFLVNRGACVAVNDTVRRSQGEYICLLNSDDLFLPHKLQTQVEYLDSHPEVGAVFSRCAYIDESGAPMGPDSAFLGRMFDVSYSKQSEFLRHFFYLGNCICHPSVMIRRRCYEEIGLYDERLAQLPDLDLWMRMVPRFQIHVMSQPLVLYRILSNAKNACALRVDSALRLEWEGLQILRNYLSLSDNLFGDVFAPEITALGLDPTGSRKMNLAKICLASNKNILHRFGIEMLYEYLPPYSETAVTGFEPINLIQETGRRDIYNTLSLYRIAQLEQRVQQMQMGQA